MLEIIQESIYGVDLSFDARFGTRGSKDVVANFDNTDFVWISGVQALAQELQRLFDLTPDGSFVDDPSYGIRWSAIGAGLPPNVAIALTKVEILRALQHPSFSGRCRPRYLNVRWSQAEPNALRCDGILQVFGFEGIDRVRFGPYLLRLPQYG